MTTLANTGSASALAGRKAFSYVRFSTSQQQLGDSLRRQVEMAEKYCQKMKLKLQPVSYRDLGVSAFKKRNLEKGALAAFIGAVKSGVIPQGSVLVVEQFDRLSRSDVDIAVRLLLDLVHSGITLVTLVDERIWDREAVKDITMLILAIVFMSRANNESAMKAERISHSWGAKKRKAAETGLVITSECPRWLRVKPDRSGFEIIEDRVESIRKVFSLRTNGFGIVAITNRANKEKWPAPAKGESWHTSLVGRLLVNRALLGEYQPCTRDDSGKRIPSADVIQDYYPRVLTEEEFLRVQAVADRHGRFPGRRDINCRNFLQGLLRCSCGASFVRKNKANSGSKHNGYARYYCVDRNRGVTSCPSVGSKELEGAIIYVVSSVAPMFFQGSARTEALKASVDTLEVDLSAAIQKRDRYLEAIASSDVPIPVLIQRLNASESEVEISKAALKKARGELVDLSGDTDTVFENIANAAMTLDNVDARATLREDLGRVIERCVVHPDKGYIEVWIRGGEYPVTHPFQKDAELPFIRRATVQLNS